MLKKYADETLAERMLRLGDLTGRELLIDLGRTEADAWDLVDLCCEIKRFRRRLKAFRYHSSRQDTIDRYRDEYELLIRAAQALGILLDIAVQTE